MERVTTETEDLLRAELYMEWVAVQSLKNKIFELEQQIHPHQDRMRQVRNQLYLIGAEDVL